MSSRPQPGPALRQSLGLTPTFPIGNPWLSSSHSMPLLIPLFLPQSPAPTLLLEDEACWLRTLPRALTEAEANAEIHRKGWYLALPSRPSGRWRSFGSSRTGLKGKLACSEPGCGGAGHHPPSTPINLGPERCLPWGWGSRVSRSQQHSQGLWETTRAVKEPKPGRPAGRAAVPTGPGPVQSGHSRNVQEGHVHT